MSDAPHQQHGFTLLEIMMAMSLLAIALALSSPTIMDLFGSMGRGSAATTVESTSSIALRMFQSDIEQAISARPTGDFNDVNAASVTSTAAALSSLDPVNHDIAFAGRTEIGFFADVLSTMVEPTAGGPEFIVWKLNEDNTSLCGKADTDGNWCVVRTVSNTANTSTFSTETVIAGQGNAPTDQFCAPGKTDASPPATRLFCYRRSIDNGAATTDTTLAASHYDWTNSLRTGQCTQSWSDWVSPPTTPPTPTPLSIGVAPGSGMLSSTEFVAVKHNGIEPVTKFHAFLDTITSVGVVMPSTSVRSGARETSTAYGEVSITSRNTPIYLAAIMCGDR